VARPQAIFFDVDFTLIHPGPRFQGSGYHESCSRHGIATDAALFDAAVAGAAELLHSDGQLYDAEIYIAYTRRIIEGMGGSGPAVDRAAREIYADWAEHHHFDLYPDVAESLAALRAEGYRLGLISNSHRCLASFQSHFELHGLISVAVSSLEHGYLKPHPSIFRAALTLMDVPAADAVMVGDSLNHDVRGAMEVGMRGVLIARSGPPAPAPEDVPVIATLRELPRLLKERALRL
jgi:putative hydrolase of the HAD superfamily